MIDEMRLRNEILERAHSYGNLTCQQKPFIAGESYIPASAKVVDKEDLCALIDASLDMWLTAGRYAKEFEQTLPAKFGRKVPALLTNSGSSANLLAVSALVAEINENLRLPKLSPGDEVITVAAGFPTTVNPIFQNQLTPVFVDVDISTLNASPEMVEGAITNKTRAVILAHTLGNPYRADQIADICRRNNLVLIEDCCDALGASVGGSPVGSFGEMATVSFYPAHHITMGEGGAVLTKSLAWKKVVESLRDWGRDCWCEPGKDNTCNKRFDWSLGSLPPGYDHKYTYSNIGYNLKVTDMQAALGVSQLKKLDNFVSERRTNWNLLYSAIKNSPMLSEVLIPTEPTPGTNPSWFGFPMVCANHIDRNLLTRRLESLKVGTRLVFAGNMIKQPAYANQTFRTVGELPNTDIVMNKAFWIGVHPGLRPSMIQYMIEVLEICVKEQLK